MTTNSKYFETRTASAVVGENFNLLKSIAYFVVVVLPKLFIGILHQQPQRSADHLHCGRIGVALPQLAYWRKEE